MCTSPEICFQNIGKYYILEWEIHFEILGDGKLLELVTQSKYLISFEIIFWQILWFSFSQFFCLSFVWHICTRCLLAQPSSFLLKSNVLAEGWSSQTLLKQIHMYRTTCKRHNNTNKKIVKSIHRKYNKTKYNRQIKRKSTLKIVRFDVLKSQNRWMTFIICCVCHWWVFSRSSFPQLQGNPVHLSKCLRNIKTREQNKNSNYKEILSKFQRNVKTLETQ